MRTDDVVSFIHEFKEESMKARVSSALCLAGMVAFGVVMSAQAGQQPTPASQSATPAPTATPSQAAPPSQTPRSASADQSITLSGCIQKEVDYRKEHDAGRGGAAGTGVGVGNEFILINASPAASASAGASAASPTGTSGAMMSYELTGPGEGQAAQFVGKRVEVMGKFKAAETSASGQPTGGATAGAPPSGVDVASKDLKLREFEVSSVKEAAGACPAAK